MLLLSRLLFPLEHQSQWSTDNELLQLRIFIELWLSIRTLTVSEAVKNKKYLLCSSSSSKMSVGPENIHRAKGRRGLVSCLGKTMPLMSYQGLEEKENITLIITVIHFYILKISIFKTRATNIWWFSTTMKKYNSGWNFF